MGPKTAPLRYGPPDTRSVRKNVSLPAWMSIMADKRHINCSQVLQDGLLQRLG